MYIIYHFIQDSSAKLGTLSMVCAFVATVAEHRCHGSYPSDFMISNLIEYRPLHMPTDCYHNLRSNSPDEIYFCKISFATDRVYILLISTYLALSQFDLKT